MKATTKNILFEAWDYCDEEDKSTEYMIQYMQDVANVSFDCVINFITTQSENRESWRKVQKNTEN